MSLSEVPRHPSEGAALRLAASSVYSAGVSAHSSFAPIPLILTRPTRASMAFWHDLPSRLHAVFEPVISPLIDIQHVPSTEPFPETDAVIFTSSNGVLHGPAGDGRAAFCVGQATTDAAAARGWHAQMSGRTADDLVTSLNSSDKRPLLLHISGQHTRGDIVGRLTDIGYSVRHVIVYDQQFCEMTPQATSRMSNDQLCLVPIFSPRTAQRFSETAPKNAAVHVIALSRAVAVSLVGLPLASLTITEDPTAHAMRKAIEVWAETHCSG